MTGAFTADNGAKTYSRRAQGALRLAEHFTVEEFACRDGSDEVRVAGGLVALLEALRGAFGAPVTIISGFRTAAYNTAVGGARASQHCLGTAADLVILGAAPSLVAERAETLLGNGGGIGLYPGFTHVDVRQSRARWDSRSGREVAVSGFGAAAEADTAPAETLRRGDSGEGVRRLQRLLRQRGAALTVDGSFGPLTEAAVLEAQRAAGLEPDGIVGPLTWAALPA